MSIGLDDSVGNGWLDGTFATDTCWVKLHTGHLGSAGGTASTAATFGGSRALSSSQAWVSTNTTAPIAPISITPIAA